MTNPLPKPTSVDPLALVGTHASPMIVGFCKRGHPRTKETTFERKSRQGEKLYIVRECRICHSMRNARKHDKTGRKNNSKWLRFIEARS